MKKRIISLMLMPVLAISLLAGCGDASQKKEEVSSSKSTEQSSSKIDIPEDDSLEEVDIKLVTINTKTEDFDDVMNEVKALVKEKVNANLEVEVWDWAEWGDKYPLAFASGEAIDLIFAANFTNYTQYAAQDGYYKLTKEMIQQYAPNSWNCYSEDEWERSKINGEYYMIPNGERVCANPCTMVLIRGDLREKYNIPEVTDWDSYVNYMEIIAEKDDSILAYNCGSGDGGASVLLSVLHWEEGYNLLNNMCGIAIDMNASIESGEPVFVDVLEDEAFMNSYKQIAEWREKGLWSQSAMSNDISVQTAFINGTSASLLNGSWGIGTTYTTVTESHPEWKVEAVELFPDRTLYENEFLTSGYAVHANSENPERALMVMDLLRHDEEIHNLFTYGIEGVHYEFVGDDSYINLDGKSFSLDMGLHNGSRRVADTWCDIAKDQVKKVATEMVATPYTLFNFNTTPVSTEYAALSAVVSEYYPILRDGFAEDVEATFAEFRERAEEVGLNKVLDEYKAQLATYMETLK